MKKIILSIIFFLFFFNSFSQENNSKQTNQTGSDILADAPWRMKKTNASGYLNGIPLHIFIKDADVIGNNAELISLNIYIKNASDESFGNPILFDLYTNNAFLSLFSSKSVTDPDLDIQSFNASLPVKNPGFTIGFSADTCSWPDDCEYVDITHAFWYFTFTIPPDKLTGFNDIIDIKVEFSLNWQIDVISNLRVFRYDKSLPKLPGWYRGDSHYHSMYTNNSAEYGLPLSSSKEAAKNVGIDWISLNDHSCDYDNYGTDIQSNWDKRMSEIQSLNTQDTSMILIGATEVSVNNSAGDIIHMLCYPSGNSPYALPYLGDGNGDLSSTSLGINDILFPLIEINGFAYAAHPFSSGDELSSLIDGGIWNVGDADYYSNGTPIEGFDEVICNDLSYPSDFYSQNQNQMLFKSTIKGGQIWNCRNALTTTDEMTDPWNINYDSGITPFEPYDAQNTMYHYNRFLSNFETTRFLWKKGLIQKNTIPALQNYRFNISAGSDAHGSYNYSNTDFVMGVVADIHDNAIGKPATLVYCPQGMGDNGNHVLSALQNGNVLISDGPLVTIGLSTDGINSTCEYFSGQEAIPTSSEYFQSKLKMDIATTLEYGTISSATIVAGTINGEHSLQISVNPYIQNGSFLFNLDSLVEHIVTTDSILENEYFYLRAELTTYINYSSQSTLYCRPNETFHCFTNPIWIRKPHIPVTSSELLTNNNSLKVFPNPANDYLTITLPEQPSYPVTIKIYDILGSPVSEHSYSAIFKNELIRLSIQNLPKGVYYISVVTNNFNGGSKFMKN